MIKRTPLKHKPTTPLKRSYIKPYGKKHKSISKNVLREVCIRDGGTWVDGEAVAPLFCRFCGQSPDFRGSSFCHLIHRKMGGRYKEAFDKINSESNIIYAPELCHDRIDGRTARGESQKFHRTIHTIKEVTPD
jgi:hypothetical protein